MSPLLIFAIIVITLALVFYSIGVIGEARRKILQWKDVVWFAAGLICDFTGTMMMRQISLTGQKVLAPWASQMMTISGTAAILLMLIHIIFAAILLIKNTYLTKFHKWSLLIYSIWLISYIIGPLGLMF